MKAHQKLLARIMALVLGIVLCGLPEYGHALPQQNVEPQNDQQNQQSGTTVNPAQGPLTPVPTQNEPSTLQPGPENSTQPVPATPPPEPRPELQMQRPLGAATAEGMPTVGGAASRPAGEAIAPAKQSQKRSLLLKMGLIAAVGVAGGTVYALSKGTSSKPK
jgi:hypothetical protein